MSGSSTEPSSPPLPRRPSTDGSGRRWMQGGRLDTGTQWAFIDSLERPSHRQSRDTDVSMRYGEFPATSTQTSTLQGTNPSGRHAPIDFARLMPSHPAGDRKRRLTSTGEYARLQRTRSGEGPRRNDTLSGGPLPHRSSSMIANPSRATSFRAAGSSYDMAIDITSSPPNPVSRLSYQDSMQDSGDLARFSRSSAASRSGPSFPASLRAEMGSDWHRNEDRMSSFSHPYSWNGSGSMDSEDAYRGGSSEIAHRGSRHVTVHRYGSANHHSNSGLYDSSRSARRYGDGRFEQSLDAYGAGSSVTERGLRRASNSSEWHHGERGGLDELTLPRWQPDAEVSECPICGTVFSFWHRKHHCRKCGRVVCAACSPHRITIPRQFIVRPPESTALTSSPAPPPSTIIDLTGDDSLPSTFTINPALGGGEEVRLCNPCVPDPNPNPPGYSSLRPHGHRSTHSLSSTMGNALSSDSRRNRSSRQERRTVGANDRPSFLRELGQQVRQNMLDTIPNAASQELEIRRARRAAALAGAASTGVTTTRVAPPPARPLRPPVSERDLCPICGRQFPPISDDEPLESREAHIRHCIETFTAAPAQQEASTQQGPANPHLPSAAAQMVEFKATEKDCLGEDGQIAECTICMEDYEVGQQLARLQCFCKFHKTCIVGWFERKRECPVHKAS